MPKRLFMLWSFTRTAIFFNCTICLHSTQFVCTALVINLLRSVDNFVFYLHCRLHLPALTYTYLHLPTLICTCLHLSTLVYTYLHLFAR